MLAALELLTVLWLGAWALRAVLGVARGERQPVLVVLGVHFLFCGLPLLLDRLIGRPLYIYTPGFFIVTRDPPTAAIYCLYVSAAPLFWWWLGRGRSAPLADEAPTARALIRLRPMFMALIASPLLALILAPDPALYLSYGAAASEQFNSGARSLAVIFEDPARYKDVIFTASFLCLVGTAGLLASYPRIAIAQLYALAPWWLLAIWLNGKRYIVAMFLFVVGYMLWDRGHLRGGRLAAALSGALLLMTLYSFAYQLAFRGANLQDNDRRYENARMDYGRDDQIKLAIYAELHPERMRILEHRGQSLLFYLTFPVPRVLWPEKPFPYAVYSTSTALMFSGPRQIGWSLTTTVLEEAVANASWAGMLLGPALVALVCRLGEACRNGMVSALTALIACLFLAVHLNAFMVLFVLWVAVVAWQLWRRRVAERQGGSDASLRRAGGALRGHP